MKTIAVIAAALLTSAASAQMHVVTHGISHHSSNMANGQPYNERNAGIGIRYEINSDVGIQAGVFKNSLSVRANYMLADYTPIHAGKISAGIFAARVTGYPLTNYAAGAIFRVDGVVIDRASITVRVTPKFQSSPSATAIEFGWRL